MKPTNLLITTLLVILFNTTSIAQCLAPSGLNVTAMTTTTATLQWTSNNVPIVDHCWHIEVFPFNGGAGMCGAGQEVWSGDVCTNTPGITWNNMTGVVSYTVTGLQPGTEYQYSLIETCDGMQGNSGACTNATSLNFSTFDDPFAVTYIAARPSCPHISPGYVPDGSFQVTITDGGSCTGLYDIVATPVVGSGPAGSTPPFTIPNIVFNATDAGSSYFFTNAGAGSYSVQVFELGLCNHATNPEMITVVVPDGIDNVDPIWQIEDQGSAMVVADNNIFTIPGTTSNLGVNQCTASSTYIATGFDLCDGFITDLNALSVVSVTPANGADVVITPNGFGSYQIDVDWYLGTTTIVFGFQDASGNAPNLTLIRTSEDNTDPIWQIEDQSIPEVVVDNNIFTIPGTTANLGTVDVNQATCSVMSTFNASGFDLCDGFITDLNALSVVSVTPANGADVVITPDGMGDYQIDIEWFVGTTTIVLAMQDDAGNDPNLTLILTAEDNVDPIWEIQDQTPEVLVDNNPFTIPGTTYNFGTIPVDPVTCSVQTPLDATGFDLCYGSIVDQDALKIQSMNPPGGANVILTPDGLGNYGIDIDWFIGTTTIVLTLEDSSGNDPALTLIMDAIDFAPPGPLTCQNINVGIDPAGYATFQLADFLPSVNCSEDVSIVVESQYGSNIFSKNGLNRTDQISIPEACKYLTGELKIVATNQFGSCWSKLTLSAPNGPVLMGTSYDIWCTDPLLDVESYLAAINNEDIAGPSVEIPCGYLERAPSFVADWVNADFECGNDTAKVVYREWEAFDKNGKRGTTFDTMVVFRLPQIHSESIFCTERSTIYCGDTSNWNGPTAFFAKGGILPILSVDLIDVGFDEEGDLKFHPIELDPKCGLQVHVDAWKFEGDPCEQQYKVTIELKQSCPGGLNEISLTPGATNIPGGPPIPPNVWVPLTPDYTYWKCEFWVTDLDTAAPVAACKYDYIEEENLLWPFQLDNEEGTVIPNNVHCYNNNGEPVIIVPTTTHDCAAYTYIPPICVYDWTGVKQVKASISGLGAWVLQPNGDTCEIQVNGMYEDGECWQSHDLIALPKSEGPVQVLYEVYDSCHNIDSIYCYLLVKDKTKPLAVTDKGVTVSLTDKKVWVDAETFDEGSWDNCGLNLLLARRSDWYEACIDLCDNKDLCYVGPHHDSLWYAYLETDKNIDPVEAHYAKTIEWLLTDEVPCSRILANAWVYDLLRYSTSKCFDHPYDVTNEYINDLLYHGLTALDSGLLDKFYPESPHAAFGCPEDGYVFGSYAAEDLKSQIDTWSQIGGGWSDAVPFSCDDACGPVTVEILVMDYWCNWSTAWTKVWVEDKTPVKVEKDVVAEEQITCKTYKDARYDYPGEDHPVSIEYIIEKSKSEDSTALAQLDYIFGGYEKAWRDPYNNYVDIDGHLIDCDIPFYDSVCDCTTDIKPVRVYDDHHGYVWKDSLITECFYDQDTIDFQKGIVVVNCYDNVYCEQEVWCDFDHCGQGYIYRKWKIWQGCPASFYDDKSIPDSLKHPVDTITRHQRIWVGNECELDKYMFDVPGDVTVYSCGIEYDPAGSGQIVGTAGPEYTGYATYNFDDDCRIVGIAHNDKVFKVVGGEEACYKIIRTWYFADWCGTGGVPAQDNWWYEREFVVDSCVQKIIVVDTVAPVCIITGPVEDGGSIEIGGCSYDLSVEVDASDACGINKYYWELKDLTDDKEPVFVDSGDGELNMDTVDNFTITSEDLYPGYYVLKVQVQDDCSNESYCEYHIQVESGKKPAPVCVSSVTARLTPWDTNQDGEVDSAHAVVWAEEFNSSSVLACDDDSIAYRLEFIDLVGDSTYMDDGDSLALGCDDIGTHLVRLWVLSYPSGTADFCDVVLIVQSDFSGCGTNVGTIGDGSVQQIGMTTEQKDQANARSMSGGVTNVRIPADAGSAKAFGLDSYQLGQNRPNPFREETTVDFTLPASMSATITVYDVTGRTLRIVSGEFVKGANSILFKKEDIGADGILYYQLRAGEFVATKKMLLIK